jgi:hypothetical protein
MTGFTRVYLAVATVGLILLALGAASVFAQGAGHRVGSNQVTISGRSQWQNWDFPQGTLVISPTGEVQTQRIKKNTNAVFGIVDYLSFNPPVSLGGIEPEEIVLADAIKGDSNVEDVVNVFDGDISTYWEPAEPRGDSELAAQWWFVVDLGRLVLAKQLVVRFVEEGAGDPFLQFEVLVSDGLKPARLSGGDTPAFKTVLRTLKKNKSQRVFEIDLTNQQPSIEAAPVRFVQLLVTGTDGALAAEITQAEYEALDAGLRGAIQYSKRQPDGREVPVERELYEALEAERQGTVRYFRREVPRLAELEVWNEGDELVSGIFARGGTVTTTATQPLALRNFIDGDLESKNRIFYGVSSAVANPDLELVFDLGSFYWVDTYRLAYNSGLFPSYRIDFSDGSLAPDGSLQWTTKASLGTRASSRYEGSGFEPIKARYGRFQWTLDPIGARTADIAELQFYGEGFQPEVSLKSDLIRLGGSRNLLSIEWDADTPPGTRVEIQTRTGSELGENFHYFKNDGTEVTESEYGKLLSLFKGDIVAEQVPGNDWSNFSEPYENSLGSPVNSPSPREFLTVRATLISDDPDISPTLRSIRLNFSSPVAQSLVGEISPFQVDELGVRTPFSFYVRPQFDRSDPGFDELLLVVPSNMELNLVDLFGGGEGDFDENGGGMSALEEVEILPTGRDSLYLRFAEIRPNDGTEVLRLDFETSLFVTGVVLQASLRNSSEAEGGTWQRIDSGDALSQIVSNTTTVVSSVANNSLLTDVQVTPAVFSPNGDAINDQVVFAFNVVRVGDDSPVAATIYDFSGRQVRRVTEQRLFSTGQYSIAWDGLNDGGAMVPPGLYFVKLEIQTDIEGANVKDQTVLRTVAVTY